MDSQGFTVPTFPDLIDSCVKMGDTLWVRLKNGDYWNSLDGEFWYKVDVFVTDKTLRGRDA